MPVRTAPEAFDRLASEWDALADQVGAPPFVRPGCIAAWWHAYGAGELQLIEERGSAGLEAVLPIRVRHGVASSPSSWQLPEFGVAYADDASGSRVLRTLFEQRHQLLSLRFLDRDDPFVGLLVPVAEQHRYRAALRTMGRCPFVVLEGDWDSYERGLSRNLRGDLRRCRRRLADIGAVSLSVSASAEELDKAFALEQMSWKGTSRTAMASQPTTKQFWTELANWAEARGYLRLIFLCAEERKVAFHLALESGGRYLPLKGGFDPEFGECSPGKLIIHATLERAFELGLSRYEFLAGDEDYKLRWATAVTDRLHFQAFAPTVRGRSMRLADACGRPIARRAVARARALRAR